MSYSQDTWLTPITIDSTNNVLVVTEDPGGGTEVVVTITVDAGTYYPHDDSSFHATKKGLWHTLTTLLNGGPGTTSGYGSVTGTAVNTYAFTAVDPTGSTGLTNNGLKLTAATAAKSWEITWTGATTMDAHWFGSILSSPLSDDASSTSGSDEVFTWPHATKHRLITRDLGDGHAVDKHRRRYKDVRYSSSRPSDSVAVVWDEGFMRRFRYEHVPAVEVLDDMSSHAEYYTITGRASTDAKGVWYDVWDALTDAKEVIVVHNSTSDLQVDTHDYDVIKLMAPMPWEGFAELQSAAGLYYAINVPAWISSSTYDH